MAREQEGSRGQPGRQAGEGPVRATPSQAAAARGGAAVGTPLPHADAGLPCPLRGFVVTPGFIRKRCSATLALAG